MRRIGSSNGLFVNGNPSDGTPGTIVTAEWLNTVQEEIISVLTAAGVAIDPAKTDQLSTAMANLLRGRATVSVAGGAGVTLTAAQHSLPILILTGALTANINVIFPAISGTWIVRNQTTGSFTVTCKTAAGSGVVVSQGTSNALWGDGTNIYTEQSDWANLGLTGTPTAPTPSPGTNTTQVATMAAVQQAVNGKLTKSVAGGANVSLTATEAGYAMLEFTGVLTANISVVVPATTGQWVVKNATTGSFALTVKTPAGSGVQIRQGMTQTIWADGTNVLETDAGKADKATTLDAYGIVDAVSTRMAAVSSFDASQVTESGFAMVTISAGNEAQSPTGIAGQFFVISVGNSLLTVAKTQLAIDRGTGLMYMRFMNGGPWSGWKRIAEAATTLAGYGITDAVASGAFVGANQWLAASGYQKLPGGLIIQWGQLSSANGTVTFPIAFPSNCASVVCTADAGNSYIAYAKSFTLTNFLAAAVYPGTGGGAATNYRWLAIGY